MMPPEEFLDRLGLSAGVPYEPEALDTRIASYVERVAPAATTRRGSTPAVSFADDDRVANLTLTVTPGPRVRVVFTGDPLPGDTRAELVPIEREGSADEDLLEDSSNRIEEYLRAQGYRDATAPHTREEADGELLITFAVKRVRDTGSAPWRSPAARRCRLADFASEPADPRRRAVLRREARRRRDGARGRLPRPRVRRREGAGRPRPAAGGARWRRFRSR